MVCIFYLINNTVCSSFSSSFSSSMSPDCFFICQIHVTAPPGPISTGTQSPPLPPTQGHSHISSPCRHLRLSTGSSHQDQNILFYLAHWKTPSISPTSCHLTLLFPLYSKTPPRVACIDSSSFSPPSSLKPSALSPVDGDCVAISPTALITVTLSSTCQSPAVTLSLTCTLSSDTRHCCSVLPSTCGFQDTGVPRTFSVSRLFFLGLLH